MYYSVSSAVSVGLILLNTSGQLQAFGGMVAGNTFLVDVKIPLDAPAVP
jgi:hypothetical protein